MFGVGTPELLVILIVALVVLGPKRLPEVAKALGKGLAELRKATSGLTDELNNARILIEEEARLAERKKPANMPQLNVPPTEAKAPTEAKPATETAAAPAEPAAPAKSEKTSGENA